MSECVVFETLITYLLRLIGIFEKNLRASFVECKALHILRNSVKLRAYISVNTECPFLEFRYFLYFLSFWHVACDNVNSDNFRHSLTLTYIRCPTY